MTSKPITPAAHAVADYSVAAVYLALGAQLARRHPRAAKLAFLNGALAVGLSMLTDYPGGVWRVLSFKTHGVVDGVHAALAGAGPRLFGFANDPEASYFHGLAAGEASVIAATDWNAA